MKGHAACCEKVGYDLFASHNTHIMLDMRHRLRYERGGASHASCRHRNLVKLKCVSLNVSGLQGVGKFVRFCRVAKRWAADGKVQVLCLQEHNLHPDKEDEHIRIALLNQADSLQE